jgi:type II secretory pathway pseudopilin PulG
MFWLSTPNPVLSPQALSRIELLVVVAIFGVFIALSLQTVQAVCDAARRAARTNNRKQTGLALQRVHANHRALPRAYRQPVPADNGGAGRR